MRIFQFFLVTFIIFSSILATLPARALDELAPERRLAPLTVPDIVLQINPLGREVFSLKDVREGNHALLERIIATRMDFPLMFDPLGQFARELFPNPERTRFGRNFMIVIRLSPIVWPEDSLPVLHGLQTELAAQRFDLGRTGRDIRLELLVFMKNYEILRDYAANYPGAGPKARQEVVKTLEEVYQVCRRVLEFKVLTLNGVRTLDEIEDITQEIADEENKSEFERFVAEAEGMGQNDINSLLALRDPSHFRQLCLERTVELLADSESGNVEKLLSSVGPADAIVLAAYFARDRIREYRNPLDQMAHARNGNEEEIRAGDCRHFAGLALHYLNLVVKPLNPALRNWYFGVERADISDYHHAYVTAVHVAGSGENTKLDLFFFDPVALSSRNMGRLDTKDVRALIDAASKDTHFFNVTRYGEDFVAHRDEKKLRDAPAARDKPHKLTVDSLLND